MKTKICTNCKKEKNISDFRLKKDKHYNKYYLYSCCKDCEKTYSLSKKAKEKKKVVDKKYRETHKEKICMYFNKRKKNDKLFKLKCQVRSLLWLSFNKKNCNKAKRYEEILDCSIENFVLYLLKTYKNNYGVEWDGKEKVHIDHIKPLKYAKTEEDVIKLCHYTNLQLLKEKDNLEKGCKINWELTN